MDSIKVLVVEDNAAFRQFVCNTIADEIEAVEITETSDGSEAVQLALVTQESSRDVVQEAFRIGARGYVVKREAGRDLVAALRAALSGDRFVSRREDGLDFSSGLKLLV